MTGALSLVSPLATVNAPRAAGARRGRALEAQTRQNALNLRALSAYQPHQP
jgi:hypothetical protein